MPTNRKSGTGKSENNSASWNGALDFSFPCLPIGRVGSRSTSSSVDRLRMTLSGVEWAGPEQTRGLALAATSRQDSSCSAQNWFAVGLHGSRWARQDLQPAAERDWLSSSRTYDQHSLRSFCEKRVFAKWRPVRAMREPIVTADMVPFACRASSIVPGQHEDRYVMSFVAKV